MRGSTGYADVARLEEKREEAFDIPLPKRWARGAVGQRNISRRSLTLEVEEKLRCFTSRGKNSAYSCLRSRLRTRLLDLPRRSYELYSSSVQLRKVGRGKTSLCWTRSRGTISWNMLEPANGSEAPGVCPGYRRGMSGVCPGHRRGTFDIPRPSLFTRGAAFFLPPPLFTGGVPAQSGPRNIERPLSFFLQPRHVSVPRRPSHTPPPPLPRALANLLPISSNITFYRRKQALADRSVSMAPVGWEHHQLQDLARLVGHRIQSVRAFVAHFGVSQVCFALSTRSWMVGRPGKLWRLLGIS